MWLDICFVACSILLSLAGLYRRRRARLPLPPGPKGYPIFGNILDIPSQLQWVKYLEWSKVYNSDIIYVNVFGRPVVVLNSHKSVNDILSARSLLYSDRPPSVMVHELLGWGSMPSHMPYAHAWRARRRAFWQEFNPANSLTYHQAKQLWWSRDFLRRLLYSPTRFLHHIEYTLAGSIIASAYGVEVEPEHDINIERAKKVLVQLNEAPATGSFVIDILPILKYIPSWIPGMGFKAYAESVRPDTLAMRNAPYEQGCERLRSGNAEPSVLSRFLARGEHGIENHPDEDIIKDVTWVACAGGAETSPLVLSTFIAAMLLHPEVQIKAQEQLDAHLGSRLPVFADMPHLPYIRAILLEVLRWQPVLPLGAPHRVTMDDEYKGYFIPKGATVLANVWALLRDEEYYPDADKFKPERFLEDGQINPRPLDSIPNFGFGRRFVHRDSALGILLPCHTYSLLRTGYAPAVSLLWILSSCTSPRLSSALISVKQRTRKVGMSNQIFGTILDSQCTLSHSNALLHPVPLRP